ncbi:hypothetical protein [Pseudomonas atacamensis]|uniref:hypothetical protein n=1 Tax=Pseudomonas atacamensis TaxID=2565368 RepID=UPI002B1D8A77|nr:hypothetical protein [Pseudomonas atacamensis]
MHIRIKYQDGAGNITERDISDPCKETDKTIDAFCHMRSERRSFHLDRILHSVATDTGELLNPYQLVPIMRDPESLDSLTWRVRPAIKALKFFSLTTRGFSKRERQHLNKFVKELVALPQSDEEISAWVYDLWCADMYQYRDGDDQEYKEILEYIPPSLLEVCRAYAIRIVGGAANKPENSAWGERIEEEFGPRPLV